MTREPFLTCREIGIRLNITTAVVRRMIRNGLIRGVKFGPRVWRVSEEALEKYLELRANTQDVTAR